METRNATRSGRWPCRPSRRPALIWPPAARSPPRPRGWRRSDAGAGRTPAFMQQALALPRAERAGLDARPWPTDPLASRREGASALASASVPPTIQGAVTPPRFRSMRQGRLSAMTTFSTTDGYAAAQLASPALAARSGEAVGARLIMMIPNRGSPIATFRRAARRVSTKSALRPAGPLRRGGLFACAGPRNFRARRGHGQAGDGRQDRRTKEVTAPNAAPERVG